MSVERSIHAACLLLMALTAGCGVEMTESLDTSDAVVHRAADPVASFDEDLQVVSWNIKGSNSRQYDDHLDEIVRIIERERADVVLLQEVHRNTKASGGIDQFVLLSESLDMNGCFGESLSIGEEGSYGNAILTTGSIEGAEVFQLPGEGEPRTLLRCSCRWGELTIPVMTTHLTAWDRFNRRSRRLQIGAIESIVEKTSSPLTVIGGDFNASLASSEMASLRDDPTLNPVFTDYVVTHPGTGRNYDHLLVSDGWTIGNAKVLREGPSDHWPVMASISLAGATNE